MPEPDGIRKRKVIGFRGSRIRGWYRKTNGKRVPELEREGEIERTREGGRRKREKREGEKE